MVVILRLRVYLALAAAAALVAAPASLASPADDGDDAPPLITIDEAAAYEGRTVEVEGSIRSTRVIRSMSGRQCVLGFGPSVDHGLTLRIYPRVYDKFPRRPEVYFRNRRVRARGKISLSNGEPRIVLTSPGRLKRVAAEDGGAAEAEGAEPEPDR